MYFYTYKYIWIRKWLENPWDIWPGEGGKGIPRGEVLAEGLFLFLRRQELNVTVPESCPVHPFNSHEFETNPSAAIPISWAPLGSTQQPEILFFPLVYVGLCLGELKNFKNHFIF